MARRTKQGQEHQIRVLTREAENAQRRLDVAARRYYESFGRHYQPSLALASAAPTEPKPDKSRGAWWEAHYRRAIRELCVRARISQEELLERLGVESVAALAPRPRRLPKFTTAPRGRPRRELERAAVVGAMQRSGGSIRAAAVLLDEPRMTLARYLDRENIDAAAWRYGEGLREAHCYRLAASGVAPHVAAARGYTSAPTGLAIPIWDGMGVKRWTQVRLDEPKRNNARYWNPRNAVPVVDVPPGGASLVLGGGGPLWVAESPRGADALASVGEAAVAVQGARLVCQDGQQWERLGVRGRVVRVVFDADALANPEVHRARAELVATLTALGASVTVIELPPIAPKASIDDWLGGGRTVAQLLAAQNERSAKR